MTYGEWLQELDTEFLRLTGRKHTDFANKDWFADFLAQIPIPVLVEQFLREKAA